MRRTIRLCVSIVLLPASRPVLLEARPREDDGAAAGLHRGVNHLKGRREPVVEELDRVEP